MQRAGLLSRAVLPAQHSFPVGLSDDAGTKCTLSLDSARRVVANVRVEQVEQFPTIQFFRTVPMLSLVRFARWEEILEEPEPCEPFAFARAIWHYGRGVAHAALGDLGAARVELAAIEGLEPEVDEIFMGNVYPARDLLEIAKSLLSCLLYTSPSPRDGW